MAKKKEAYLSLSAMLRAREPKLLNAERAGRMLEASSFEEAAKLLTDCGYPDLSQATAGQIEQTLTQRRVQALDELEKLCPERAIVDFFRIKYDAHNAKVLLKAEAMGTDASSLFSGAGRIAPEKLQEAWQEERLSELPKRFGEALLEARNTLARTANPQLSDFVLDRAMFEEMLDAARIADCPFLTGYARLLIDSCNLKSLVRTARMHKDADFLGEVLLPGGGVDRDRLLAAGEGEGFAALFAHSPLEKAAALGAEALEGGSMTAFERACDDGVNAYLRAAKLVSYGPETVAAYLAAVEGEITAVRMILTGRLSGIAPEAIRERLRDLYA
ncbi:MAG: V-type ATPase subunit [Oscillospiraceae bacterium]|nr:V-type ATPase subunit [Oscillospiraceae bacterium]